MSRKIRCRATISFGDDYGDNSTTFRCQLEKGHKHYHTEKGKLYGKEPYRVYWTVDSRIVQAKYDLDEARFLHCRHKWVSKQNGTYQFRECSKCEILDIMLPGIRKLVRNARLLLKRLGTGDETG